ncbi:polysaccharide pyruvyl transferase family protein [Actinomycetospora chibensis]|uniref:Polysaccharide pyruvyl transferase family protein n=1 Tax=Actinomycetospora chibensis TaxID=663606 RepID=A0ABV9RK34_9PSEU|nr:polysaccharide pyruvyl transferase family protein [Actinomycetospora chibensis]MDD7923288.1 polysaccharide pyruvyl transferase family protein [Actinomycetospora chibensis]
MLVENGEYWLNNKGDLAMLAVMVRRIAGRWPDGRIGVLTSAPALLTAYEPTVEPIFCQRGGDWPRRSPRARVTGRWGPAATGPLLNGLDAARALPRRIAMRLRRRHPSDDRASEATGVNRRSLHREGGRLPNALGDTDVVIAIGGGYLTDVDRAQTERTLDLLEYATEHGIPTAMVGHGIGPLRDEELLRHAERVLPRVDLIALREGVRGPELLRSLGVPADRVVVTGDDAIELSYATRNAHRGSAIGTCLRVAEYSPVTDGTRTTLGRVLRAEAAERSADLIPLIVSEHAAEDRRSTLPLIEHSPAATPPLGRFASPWALARQVGRCRIVVSGAYHVAVFALAQGIPVVGLSSSRYYDDKFEGLATMFGTGLELVRLDSDDVEDRLRGSISRLWTQAPDLRAPLLEAAACQIDASRAAFEQAATIIDAAVDSGAETTSGRSPISPG